VRARLTGARLGDAVLLDHPGEERLALGKGLYVRADAVFGADHQAMLAA
jgi:hypothetical protein